MSHGILFLRAQTALHPGSGTAVGAVDLPIQRERSTNWPTIQGSAIKGILRDACREYVRQDARDHGREIALGEADHDPRLQDVFGPSNGDLHAGALAVTDARILAFPVRSAKGVFVWVTCQPVLERARRDLAMAGLGFIPIPRFTVGDDQALTTSEPDDIWVSVGNGKKLVLEDLMFSPVPEGQRDMDEVAGWVANACTGAGQEPDAFSDPRRRLVLLSGSAFTHLVTHATEVSTRIRLNPETKTVQGQMLFTQELLPAETILYSVLLTEEPHSDREKRQLQSPEEVLGFVNDGIQKSPLLQVGGDETTGKGWCWAHVWTRGGSQ